jgi:hypothetical protein
MKSSQQFHVVWIDAGREPRQPPDSRYPNGIDILSNGQVKCHVDLPYPARRCGYYRVHCRRCGITVAVTTAGRRDDPRSIELDCLPNTTS